MKLSALPGAFGFDAAKGWFPHLMNTTAHQNYEGPLPPTQYYAPENMNDKERAAFYDWYIEQSDAGYVFNFRDEIIKYCRMDVEILRRACLEFRKIFIAVGETDPFVSATTIASACSYVYRKKFLKPYTIA